MKNANLIPANGAPGYVRSSRGLPDVLPVVAAIVAGGVAAMVTQPLWLPAVLGTMVGDKPRMYWYLGRSSAFVALFFLWLSMVFGLSMTSKLSRRWPGPAMAHDLHRFASVFGLLIACFHAFILMGSRFLHYSIPDVLIPFHSDAYRTEWVAMGQLGFYGMAILVASDAVRRRITQRVWRLIHYGSFAVFVLTVVHGLMTGSDTGTPLAAGFYVVCAGSVLFLLGYRVLVPRVLHASAPSTPMSAPAIAPVRLIEPGLVPPTIMPPAAVASGGMIMHVVFGSQTGTAEQLARMVAHALQQAGLTVELRDGAKVGVQQLATITQLVLITSTYGDGQAPDNIAGLFNALQAAAAPALTHLRYCVLAIGDHGYATFCKAGRDFDARLAALGAHRMRDLVTCEAGEQQAVSQWLTELIAQVSATAQPAPQPVVEMQVASPMPVAAVAPASGGAVSVFAEAAPSREMTLAPIVQNVNLQARDAGRQTRGVVFWIRDSGLTYEPGDALAVMPSNRFDLVADILRVTGLCKSAPVPLPDGGEAPLCDALLHHYDISRIGREQIEHVARRTGDVSLRWLVRPNGEADWRQYCHGRDVLDLLMTHPRAVADARDLVRMLRPLKPRLYSISSSQKMYRDEVHITVGVVNYESHGRQRHGVCSYDLARATVDTSKPVRVQPNHSFRLPDDPSTPIIMIGPGTGIAPFRGFLHERMATGAPGHNWLFFGCRNPKTDFIYREEIEALAGRNVITRLDVAFSRAGGAKTYVQDRMREQARDLWMWLEAGAVLYVCGDATHMARDVDAALHEVAMGAGGRTREQAAAWVAELRAAKRYLRDVY